MKKTVTLPDGTTEVLEGTPEEIAAHERLIREKVVKEQKKKPGVLQGAPEPAHLDPEVIRKLQELIDATRDNKPVAPWWEMLPHYPPTCPYCGASGCQRVHVDPWPSPTIIYGSTVTTSNTADVGFIPELHGGLIVH